jgi:capsular exopolysaccharide synthesis family protein
LGRSRVVLVDADMRQGHLHKSMGMQCSPGLVDLLSETVELDKVIQSGPLPNLSFIARGDDNHSPGDLLFSLGFERLISQLRERFDYVLIDSSPIFAADDATTIAPKMDGVLFVVRNGVSSGRIVEEALQLLVQRQARVLGLIFNGADTSAQSYHYYKYENYYANGSV